MVAIMFILLIAISYWHERSAKEKVSAENPKVETPSPSALYFHPSHTFAKIIGDDLVEVGMDNFAKRAFGEIDSIKLPKVGSTLKQGDIAWKTQVGTRTVSQRTPVEGTILEANENTEDLSWLLKIKTSRLQENIVNLIQGASVENWLKAARAKFLANFTGRLIPAMQDGGELVYGFARHLSDDQWKEFCQEFFNSPN